MVDFTRMRREMIAAAVGKPAAHLPSAFSILEIVWAIYETMGREDKFILSKGHGAMALYAVLKERGVIEETQNIASLPGHPDARVVKGVEFSTGSLGHGLAVAAGMALGKKIEILRSAQNDRGEGGRVFCLVGDGECMEGSVWEAMNLIEWMKLKVITIVDDNLNHLMEMRSDDRFCVCDGNEVESMSAVLRNKDIRWIIARTHKGYGCRVFEEEPEAWHHRSPTLEELPELLETVY